MRPRLLLALVAVASVARGAALGHVSLRFSGEELGCLREAELRAQLQERALLAGAEVPRFSLEVSQREQSVQVRLSRLDGTLVAQRALQRSEEGCAPLARGIGLLVQAWLDWRPAALPPSAEREPEATARLGGAPAIAPSATPQAAPPERERDRAARLNGVPSASSERESKRAPRLIAVRAAAPSAALPSRLRAEALASTRERRDLPAELAREPAAESEAVRGAGALVARVPAGGDDDPRARGERSGGTLQQEGRSEAPLDSARGERSGEGRSEAPLDSARGERRSEAPLDSARGDRGGVALQQEGRTEAPLDSARGERMAPAGRMADPAPPLVRLEDVAPTSPPASTGGRLSVDLGGGGSWAPDGRVGYAFALRADYALHPRLALGAGAQLASPISETIGLKGTASLRTYRFSAAARGTPLRLGQGSLELSLRAGVDCIYAETLGLLKDAQVMLYRPVFGGSVEWRQALPWGLFATLGLSGAARTQAIVFVPQGSKEVDGVTLSPFGLALGASVGWSAL